MAIEYISYERFIQEISENRRKKTEVKYKGKKYRFWYENGKYCFQQYLPQNKSIKKYQTYEKMLEQIQIEGKSIKELWDKDGFEYVYKSIFNPFRMGNAQITYLVTYYHTYKNLYNEIMTFAQKINVKIGIEDIEFNKQFYMHLYDLYVSGVITAFIGVTGIACIMPLSYENYGDFLLFRSSLFYSHIISFVLMGFFIPLLNDEQNKISGYYKSNLLIYFYALVSIIGVSVNTAVMNTNILSGITTFLIFIISDMLCLMIGYLIYRIHYNKKLKEAEKIREEYRKEQEGKSYN